MSLTVYLDSANWYDLAKSNHPLHKFETAIQDLRITFVLSFIHLNEFARGSASHRGRVTGYIKKIQRLGGLKWAAGLPKVIWDEVINSFLRWRGLETKPICVLVDSLLDIPDVQIGWSDRADLRTFSIETWVEHLAKPKAKKDYQALRVTSPMFNFPLLRKLKETSRDFSQNRFIPNLAADLLRGQNGQIVTAAGLVCDINALKDDIDQFSKQFNVSDCPALSLTLAYFKGWSRSSGGEDASDFDDLFHMIGVAYCDVAFADKRTCDALKKARVSKLPMLNSEFGSWVESLSV